MMEPLVITGDKINLHMLGAGELSSWLDNEDEFSKKYGLTIVKGLVNKRVQEVFRLKLEKIGSDPGNVLWYTYFAIVLRDTETLIGLIGFKDIPDQAGLSEIGYGIGESYRNRGYATEAVSLLVDWVFCNTELRTVFAQTDINNIPSGKVLEKAGFSMQRQDGNMFEWKQERSPSPVM